MNLPPLHHLGVCPPCAPTGTVLALADSILCNICYTRITGGPVVVVKDENNELDRDDADLSEAVRKQLVAENGGMPITTDPNQFVSLRFKAPFYTKELQPRETPTYVVACASFPPHIFHEECLNDHIRRQLRSGSTPDCPECREPLIGKASAMQSAAYLELAEEGAVAGVEDEDEDEDEWEMEPLGPLYPTSSARTAAYHAGDDASWEAFRDVPLEQAGDNYIHPAALDGFGDFLRTQLEYLPTSVRSYEYHQVATRGYGHIEGSVDALLQAVDEYEEALRGVVRIGPPERRLDDDSRVGAMLGDIESAIAERMERDVEYNAVVAVRTVVFDEQNEVPTPSDREVRHWLAYGGINFVARQFARGGLRDARDQYEVFVRHRIDAAVRWYGEAVARGYRE